MKINNIKIEEYKKKVNSYENQLSNSDIPNGEVKRLVDEYKTNNFKQDKAIINSLGFNNKGSNRVKKNLIKFMEIK